SGVHLHAVGALDLGEDAAVGEGAIGLNVESAEVAGFGVGDVENLLVRGEGEAVGFEEVAGKEGENVASAVPSGCCRGRSAGDSRRYTNPKHALEIQFAE